MKHDFLWDKGIPQYGLDHDYITKEIKNFENKLLPKVEDITGSVDMLFRNSKYL